MDSVTQIALGAAVAEAVVGKQIGRKASLWGAIAGTIPDLDVLVPFADPVMAFTYHRSVSHSLLFLTLLAPVLTWLVLRLHPSARPHRARVQGALFLALITHPVLDCFTVYGTQLLWPFSSYPITWSTLFIIDPTYTLPLVAGVFCTLFLRRSNQRGYRLNLFGLALSSLYIVFSIAAKNHVDRIAAASLPHSASRFVSIPTPFNTLLWRVVVMDGDRYGEGFYSLLDDQDTLAITWYDHDPALLEPLADTWAVQRLQWFTKGFYRVRSTHDQVVFTDLRMGVEPNYVFAFNVGSVHDSTITAIPPVQEPMTRPSPDQLGNLWDRIWNEQVVLP